MDFTNEDNIGDSYGAILSTATYFSIENMPTSTENSIETELPGNAGASLDEAISKHIKTQDFFETKSSKKELTSHKKDQLKFPCWLGVYDVTEPNPPGTETQQLIESQAEKSESAMTSNRYFTLIHLNQINEQSDLAYTLDATLFNKHNVPEFSDKSEQKILKIEYIDTTSAQISDRMVKTEEEHALNHYLTMPIRFAYLLLSEHDYDMLNEAMNYNLLLEENSPTEGLNNTSNLFETSLSNWSDENNECWHFSTDVEDIIQNTNLTSSNMETDQLKDVLINEDDEMSLDEEEYEFILEMENSTKHLFEESTPNNSMNGNFLSESPVLGMQNIDNNVNDLNGDLQQQYGDISTTDKTVYQSHSEITTDNFDENTYLHKNRFEEKLDKNQISTTVTTSFQSSSMESIDLSDPEIPHKVVPLDVQERRQRINYSLYKNEMNKTVEELGRALLIKLNLPLDTPLEFLWSKHAVKNPLCIYLHDKRRGLLLPNVRKILQYYLCDYCQTLHKSIGKYNQHVLKHIKEKRYMCVHCTTSFHGMAEIKRHVRQHIGLRPFKCDFCERSFELPFSAEHHMHEKHDLKLFMNWRNYKDFFCEECGKFSYNLQLYQMHMLTQHPENVAGYYSNVETPMSTEYY